MVSANLDASEETPVDRETELPEEFQGLATIHGEYEGAERIDMLAVAIQNGSVITVEQVKTVLQTIQIPETHSTIRGISLTLMRAEQSLHTALQKIGIDSETMPSITVTDSNDVHTINMKLDAETTGGHIRQYIKDEEKFRRLIKEGGITDIDTLMPPIETNPFL